MASNSQNVLLGTNVFIIKTKTSIIRHAADICNDIVIEIL